MSNPKNIDNLKIWNNVKQVPINFLKTIEGGSLKGKSDINPQWRFMAMTQAFGVVGHGWTYRIIRLWSEQGIKGSVMCFAEVAVKIKLNNEWGEEFSGIGGSQIIEIANSAPKANDEGYKKAVTDALGVAFKAVGVAADIYLCNFDGSKYLFDYDHAYQDNQKQDNQNQVHQNLQQEQIRGQHKPQRTLLEKYNEALKKIKDAENPTILDAAIAHFKGSQYETGINNACRARADMMGWQSATRIINSSAQNNQMHS